MKIRKLGLFILTLIVSIFVFYDICTQNIGKNQNEINLVIDDSAAKYVLEDLDRALNEKEEIYKRYIGYQMQIDWIYKTFNRSLKSMKDDEALCWYFDTGIKYCKEDSAKKINILNSIYKLNEVEKNSHNKIAQHLFSYLPDKEAINFNIYLVVFTPVNAQTSGSNIMLRMDWDQDAGYILNVIIHEAYHIGYKKSKPDFAKLTQITPTNNQMFFRKMFNDIQNEGMATWVGYKSLDILPFPGDRSNNQFINDYFLLENDTCVKKAFKQVNQIIESSKNITIDSLNKAYWDIGVMQRAYYITGAYMSKIIEEKRGKEYLVGLIRKDERIFVNEYNELVNDDYKIKMIDY
jgi:hypothetical protein